MGRDCGAGVLEPGCLRLLPGGKPDGMVTERRRFVGGDGIANVDLAMALVDLDPQVSDRTLQLGVSEQYLHCPQVPCSSVDHGRFCAPERMCAVGSWIESNIGNP